MKHLNKVFNIITDAFNIIDVVLEKIRVNLQHVLSHKMKLQS